MMIELWLFAVVFLLSYALYKYTTQNYDYFKERNVKALTLKDVLGIDLGLFFNKYTAIDFAKALYQSFPNESIFGYFDLTIPQFVVRDPKIIKQIAVKDFDYFEDHRTFTDEKVDKLWGNSLFFMKGEKWRQMRAMLSPAFTGSKMRQMFELVTDCADDVIKHFHKQIDNGQRINIEMKDFFSRYTNDVIATCAFGIKINSFTDPENEIFLNGRTIMDFTGVKTMLKTIILNKSPALARILKLSLLDESISNSFKKTILDTIKMRSLNKIHRPDMINIMTKLYENTLHRRPDDEQINEKDQETNVTENQAWNDDEIVAQCFLFFVAGYNTSSTLLTFVAYELTRNRNIQQKLYEEILETEASLGGKRVSYDTLQSMKYMDQVICETLRKWPPNVQVDRVCVRDYMFDDGEDLKFKVEKERIFIIPIYGIQNDSKYFNEPEKFDPERFNDENKVNIIPGTYFPFGVGPRNCLGSRFALMEIKSILYHLLLNFSFEPNENTEIPIKLKKTAFSLLPENEIHLELKPRSK